MIFSQNGDFCCKKFDISHFFYLEMRELCQKRSIFAAIYLIIQAQFYP